jgi:hypothetical protein
MDQIPRASLEVNATCPKTQRNDVRRKEAEELIF